MQVYAIKLHNFMRFGEKDNSIVFDLSPKDQTRLSKGEVTLDDLYNEFAKDPLTKIKEAKERGLSNLIGIVGKIDGDMDISNGSGKSSILEGICYSHYEKIVRQTANSSKEGPAGLSVVRKINGEYPKGIEESYVEEFFEESGKVYRVKRGRSFTKTGNPKSPIIEFKCLTDEDSKEGHRSTDTKKSVEEVNVNDYDIFVNSQMMGQNDAGKFLTGTDKVVKEMIVNLLKMDHAVEGCLKLTRDKKNQNAKDIDQSEYKIESTLKDIKNLYSDIFGEEYGDNEFFDDINRFNATIEEIETEIKQCDKNISKYADKINELKNSDKIKEKERIKEEGQKVKKLLDNLNEEKEKEKSSWSDLSVSLKNTINQSEKEERRLTEKLNTLREQVINFKDHIKNNGDNFSEEDVLANKKKEKEATEKMEENKKKKSEISSEREFLIKEIGEQEGEFNYIKKQGIRLKELLDKASEEGTFKCPECDSDVPQSHFQSKLEEKRKEFEQKKELIGKLTTKKEALDEKLEVLKDEFNKLGEILYACGQFDKARSDHESLLSQLDYNKQMGKDTKASLSNLAESLKDVRKQYENALTQLSDIDKKYKEKDASYKEELEELKEKFEILDKETKDLQKEIDKFEFERQTSEKLKTEKITHVGSLRDKKERFVKLNNQKEENEKEYEELHAIRGRLLKLEKYFGLEGIQTRIVKKYLPLLNVYVKEFLDILSDGKMEVVFSINDKSKVDCVINGGASETFNMLSGGEKMIVRLAVDIGLSLLSFSRSAQAPEMVCLDEIFGPLDKSKSQAVFRMLKVLQDKFKRVILISHDADIQSMVDSNIVVEKDSGMYGLSRITKIES